MDRDGLPQDLKMLEQECDRSLWLAQNVLEPRLGDHNCPKLADSRGIRGMSLYTAFVRSRSDRTYGCHFEPCSSYYTPSLEESIRHQRDYHFNHQPFVCLPASGKPWYALLLFSVTTHSKSHSITVPVVSHPKEIS